MMMIRVGSQFTQRGTHPRADLSLVAAGQGVDMVLNDGRQRCPVRDGGNL